VDVDGGEAADLRPRQERAEDEKAEQRHRQKERGRQRHLPSELEERRLGQIRLQLVDGRTAGAERAQRLDLLQRAFVLGFAAQDDGEQEVRFGVFGRRVDGRARVAFGVVDLVALELDGAEHDVRRRLSVVERQRGARVGFGGQLVVELQPHLRAQRQRRRLAQRIEAEIERFGERAIGVGRAIESRVDAAERAPAARIVGRLFGQGLDDVERALAIAGLEDLVGAMLDRLLRRRERERLFSRGIERSERQRGDDQPGHAGLRRRQAPPRSHVCSRFLRGQR
jgi:hypothetical protein